MDKEIRKWKKKHAEAIRASMANPGACDYKPFEPLYMYCKMCSSAIEVHLWLHVITFPVIPGEDLISTSVLCCYPGFL